MGVSVWEGARAVSVSEREREREGGKEREGGRGRERKGGGREGGKTARETARDILGRHRLRYRERA